jgi:hypothetical protein
MKYRKKPVVIEADVFQWGMEDGLCRFNEVIPKETNEFHPHLNSKLNPGYLAIHDRYHDDKCFNQNDGFVPYIATLEGNHRVSEGDYIITGVKGERYPCKPDIFAMTYEAVE